MSSKCIFNYKRISAIRPTQTLKLFIFKAHYHSVWKFPMSSFKVRYILTINWFLKIVAHLPFNLFFKIFISWEKLKPTFKVIKIESVL